MTVFPSSVNGQITRAQLAKIGGNRKCLKNVHVKSEQAHKPLQTTGRSTCRPYSSFTMHQDLSPTSRDSSSCADRLPQPLRRQPRRRWWRVGALARWRWWRFLAGNMRHSTYIRTTMVYVKVPVVYVSTTQK